MRKLSPGPRAGRFRLPTVFVVGAIIAAVGAVSLLGATPGAVPGTGAAPVSYLYTFNGNPAAPAPWRPADWDIQVHSRDWPTRYQLESAHAHHGGDCAPHPATHTITAYEDAVFLCRDHVMTSIKADGYGLIYLTPNHMADFSQGEAVIRFDMSTLRTSDRDWVDLWITPYDENFVMPLQDWLPDLHGYPRDAVHILMAQQSGATTFKVDIVRNFQVQSLPNSYVGYESVLVPDGARRDTFELRISPTRIRFGMPGFGLTWVDSAISQPLTWNQGVVQFGHHSYTPTKDCAVYGTVTCRPNTWHWDNVSIAPAAPFSITRATTRYVDNTTAPALSFAAPAPANAYLRFAGVGTIEVSFDNGATWRPAGKREERRVDTGSFSSYWMPIPAGTSTVRFRGTNWYGGSWMVKDASIWSRSGAAAPSPTASPAPTAAPTPTATPRPTATATPTATPTSTPRVTPAPTAAPTATPAPTSTPRPSPTPTATPIPTASPTPSATPTPAPTPLPWWCILFPWACG